MAGRLKLFSYILSSFYLLTLAYSFIYDPTECTMKEGGGKLYTWLHPETISSIPHFSVIMLLASLCLSTPTFVYIGSVYFLYLFVTATMGIKSMATISGVCFFIVYMTRIRPPSDDELVPTMANGIHPPIVITPQTENSLNDPTTTLSDSTPSQSASPSTTAYNSVAIRPNAQLHKDADDIHDRYSVLLQIHNQSSKSATNNANKSPQLPSSPLSSNGSTLSRRATPIYIGPGMSSMGTNKNRRRRGSLLMGDGSTIFGSPSASFISTTDAEPDNDVPLPALVLNVEGTNGGPDRL